jgi:hypothetical protein
MIQRCQADRTRSNAKSTPLLQPSLFRHISGAGDAYPHILRRGPSFCITTRATRRGSTLSSIRANWVFTRSGIPVSGFSSLSSFGVRCSEVEEDSYLGPYLPQSDVIPVARNPSHLASIRTRIVHIPLRTHPYYLGSTSV